MRSQVISEAHSDPPPPSEAAIRSAQRIDLGRVPASDAARGLAVAVMGRIAPHMARGRPLARKGLASTAVDVGAILGGIMRPGMAGAVVRAQRDRSGSMWRGAVIGQHRFWRLVDAMRAAGLVGYRRGTQMLTTGFNGSEHVGLASALWPAPALLELAAQHHVTADTRKVDWTADPSVIAAPPRRTRVSLVTCKALRDVPLGMTPAMEAERARMEQDLLTINAANARVVFRGAGRNVALHRSFRHSLGFGGRFYGPAHLGYSLAARCRITMDGEPAVEVDVKASQLTLLCGLARHGLGDDRRLHRWDLYAVPGLDRELVKAWLVRTVGRGRADWTRWGDDVPDAVRQAKVRPREVWEVMRPLYPFLADLPALVPADLLATLPPEHHGWAAGQHIAAREAACIAGAMGYCVANGVPVLPVHDALIVPASRVKVAKAALDGAYSALGRVMPRLEASTLAGEQHAGR